MLGQLYRQFPECGPLFGPHKFVPEDSSGGILSVVLGDSVRSSDYFRQN